MKFSDGNVPPTSDIVVKNCQNSRSVSESGMLRARCADAIDVGPAIAATATRRRNTIAERRGSRGTKGRDITTPSGEKTFRRGTPTGGAKRRREEPLP